MVSVANLCRSPISAAVFQHVAKQRKVDRIWKFDSAAIGPWYLGCHMDIRSIRTLARHGINLSDEIKTKQLRPELYRNYDIILCADRYIMKVARDRSPIGYKGYIDLITWYDPLGAEVLIDPFYDEYDDLTRFEDIYNISMRCAHRFFDKHRDPHNPEHLLMP